MRHELIHFLSHVEDERSMASIIQNFNLEDIEIFLYYLDYTNVVTRKRWLNMCSKVLSYENHKQREFTLNT